jgi:hypothetical protein
MAGEMLGPNRSPLQAGLQLFLYLNPIGKYAWPVDCQQVLASSTYSQLISHFLFHNYDFAMLFTFLLDLMYLINGYTPLPIPYENFLIRV